MKYFVISALALCLGLVVAEDLHQSGVDFRTLHYSQHQQSVEEAKKNAGEFELAGTYDGRGRGIVGAMPGQTCGSISPREPHFELGYLFPARFGRYDPSVSYGNGAKYGSGFSSGSGIISGYGSSSGSSSTYNSNAKYGSDSSSGLYAGLAGSSSDIHSGYGSSAGSSSFGSSSSYESSGKYGGGSSTGILSSSSGINTGYGSSTGSSSSYNSNAKYGSGSSSDLYSGTVGLSSGINTGYGSSTGSSSSYNSNAKYGSGSSSGLYAGLAGSSSDVHSGYGSSAGSSSFGSSSSYESSGKYGGGSSTGILSSSSGINSGYGSLGGSTRLDSSASYDSNTAGSTYNDIVDAHGTETFTPIIHYSKPSGDFGHVHAPSGGSIFDREFQVGDVSHTSSGLHSYMTEAERLAKMQSQQMHVGGSRVGASKFNGDIGTTGYGESDARFGIGAGNGGYRSNSWEKASKWSSQSGVGPDGQVNNYKELSTGESENVDINGHRSGYKAATSTLDDNGKVSSYSLYT